MHCFNHIFLKGIHFNMINKIIHWPLLQFEKTPTGRIMNKFSKDLYTLDFYVPRNLHLIMLTFIGIISAYFEIMVIEVAMIALVFIIGVSILVVQSMYTASNRQYGRLEVVARSPILNQFIESFNGGSIISAMNVEQFMHERFDNSLDLQLRWWMNLMCTNR